MGFLKGHTFGNRFKKGNIPWNKGVSGYRAYGKKKGVCDNTGRTHFKKGMIPWNMGKKMTYTHGMLGKGHTKEAIEKIRNGNIGKKRTKKRIEQQKMWALSRREEMRKSGYLGAVKQAFMKGPTSIEKKVYQELKARGFLFESQKMINGKFLVDVYVPRLNLIIECDGDYWHSLDRVKKKDKAENAYLSKCDFSLLRLSEKVINDGNFLKMLPGRR